MTEAWVEYKYVLKLSKPSGFDVVVDLAIHEHQASLYRDTETATAARDFGIKGLGHKDKITIPAGKTSATFYVVVADNTIPESLEQITLQIEGATNAKIPTTDKDRNRYLGIQDNDAAPATHNYQSSTNYYSSNINDVQPFTIALPSNVQIYEGAMASSTFESLAGPTATPILVGSGNNSGDIFFPPGVIAINGLATQGLFIDAQVFFDANLNAIADFLDLNSMAFKTKMNRVNRAQPLN